MTIKMRFTPSLTTLLISLSTLSTTSGNRPSFNQNNHLPLAFSSSSSSSNIIKSEAITSAKTRLLEVSNRLFEDSKTGIFITTPTATKELKKAVSELEAVCGPADEDERHLMLGNWKLVCTTNYPARGGEFKIGEGEGPFGLPVPDPPEFLSKAQQRVKRSVEVDQWIRHVEKEEKETETYVAGSGKMTDKINRVDNIIEFTPFNIKDLIDVALDLNPLEVSKAKLTLAHKAEVESMIPTLRTKLSLQSVILTVAGNSQYLEPKGADVLGLNVPLGDVLNSGNFDTTYVDEDMRISRGKVGPVEQLRVFVRKPSDVEVVDEEKEDEVGVANAAENMDEEEEVKDAEVKDVEAKDAEAKDAEAKDVEAKDDTKKEKDDDKKDFTPDI